MTTATKRPNAIKRLLIGATCVLALAQLCFWSYLLDGQRTEADHRAAGGMGAEAEPRGTVSTEQPSPVLPAPPTERAYVSIGAIFKAEHRFLAEWLEYHLLVGISHFFMVSNDCGPDAASSRQLLAPYIRRGVVTLLSEYECAPRGFQNDAYTLLLRRAAGRTSWLMVVDIDEFIVPQRDADTVADAMRAYERHDAVALMWRLFGTSGHRAAPGGSVLYNFRHRASTTDARDSRARSFKSIVRPEACVRMVTHMCAQFACQTSPAKPSPNCGCTVSTDGRQCMSERHLAMRQGRPPFVNLWMHHYRTKSAEEWERKKERGRASVAEDARNSKRTGPPPDEYNCLRDDTLPLAVEARLLRLADRAEAERLRRLLLAGPGPKLGSGNCEHAGASRVDGGRSRKQKGSSGGSKGGRGARGRSSGSGGR